MSNKAKGALKVLEDHAEDTVDADEAHDDGLAVLQDPIESTLNQAVSAFAAFAGQVIAALERPRATEQSFLGTVAGCVLAGEANPEAFDDTYPPAHYNCRYLALRVIQGILDRVNEDTDPDGEVRLLAESRLTRYAGAVEYVVRCHHDAVHPFVYETAGDAAAFLCELGGYTTAYDRQLEASRNERGVGSASSEPITMRFGAANDNEASGGSGDDGDDTPPTAPTAALVPLRYNVTKCQGVYDVKRSHFGRFETFEKAKAEAISRTQQNIEAHKANLKRLRKLTAGEVE